MAETLGDYLIVGDLNAKVEPYDIQNANGKCLTTILKSTNGTIINENFSPTYYQHNYSSTLDLAIASPQLINHLNSIEIISISSLAEYQKVNFHLPVTISFRIEKKPYKKPSFHSSFIYAKADWDEVKNELNRSLIDEITTTEVDELNKIIENAFLLASNNNIPKTKQSNNRENYPSFIVDVLKARNSWTKEFKKH